MKNPETAAIIPANMAKPISHKLVMVIKVVFVDLLYRRLTPKATRKTRQNANISIPAKKLLRNSPCSPMFNIPRLVKIKRFSVKYWIGTLIT